MFHRPLIACLCASLLAATPLRAQESPVALRGEVHVVRVVDGVETRQPPEQVVPGDKLVFSTHYRNTQAVAVDGFVVTNPLPAQVMLAADGPFEVSVDGGTEFGPLASRTLTENGAVRPATLADVSHVRWTVARLEPGAEGELSYFATVR
ncbi:hypothetical protein EYB45_02440 [Erythrobacteraceae bacterium CFH 75059]|uniref:hypothetical protein n=1 Tax=Qipengyuania thermophila TaxID=2509361 RepID=UPI001020E5C5|nr:hypothetical protein [Qipengyuania thermophila]TCD06589.1 hypothetical protein EYB45_02440 [Erythrobacteraceae bacterium CFH 75059]